MKLNEFQQQFLSLYGAPAQGIAAAPGRVNLIGEFTDYNDGFVLPCSLEFRTQVMFKERDDNIITVHSLNYPGEKDSFSVDEEITEGQSQWGNYIRAVTYVLKRAGYTLRGADLLIDSNLPQGSGLSSSAALEVAVGGMFNHIAQLGLPPEQIALFGQEAENDFMHCQCGIMDQLISAKGENGHALLIDCENLATKSVKVPDDLNIVIVNSNYPRKLVDSEYNQRRIDCEQAAVKMGVETLRQATMAGLQAVKATLSENEYKRAHHVISENDRVIAATTALQNNDMDALRTLMAASHQSLKHDFEVTVPATDGLVEICKEAMGERGAVRMTGGGFGGAIVCLCRDAEVPLIKAAVEKHYFERFNLNADIYVCSAGSGLQITSF
ncbi:MULTISPECIES: galactokinase [Pseudoalteromonas]|jgi:galactokinase|uniref:Galactokinase n=1 Tax=Pseudoalteromonas arctica TaxID=394751 RepID=A0ABU9TIV8_9GAMM|nr:MULTISPECIES: galactokinase [unclassified Pseudoalteromonas]MBA6407773.1 galactokinase [Pseudoalteromonas sp. 5Ae-yellow]MBB1277217.1 galactokinase [Pseudoalteromonas sp. SR43-3]MBB1281306.1 galactokinase [Pseudoalteromonas sp. SR41-1]MBB1350700.1 galactokinase [Pseudoalteromonas sp. SG45-3]MBB1357368.1 galactokinase [Pseudoalteromonas sp. SG45-6]|tara:strand:+ start:614 stop:1762 length:1149 start_codon:yes stop_codon:yes gene_type:complete